MPPGDCFDSRHVLTYLLKSNITLRTWLSYDSLSRHSRKDPLYSVSAAPFVWLKSWPFMGSEHLKSCGQRPRRLYLTSG